MKLTAFKPAFWGVSVALSWTWGLGLFFAVQFTYQFGLTGLLSFAIPNALGLFLFGVGGQYIAGKNKETGSLEKFFNKWSSNYPSVFLFYQLVALTLTIFAVTRYLFQALDFSNPVLLLLLVVIALIAVAVLLGEQFNISKIKYSHSVLFVLLLICVGYIYLNKPVDNPVAAIATTGTETGQPLNFWGYLIPVCVGFFTGPWLDLQQWQRVIQMQKEKTSIVKSYLIGSVIFFLLLLFHGTLTLWAMDQGAAVFARKGIDGIYYAQDMLTRLLTSDSYHQFHSLALAYFTFLIICIVTTLDSGYLALRWFLQTNIKDKKNILFSVVPQQLLVTPIPYFILFGILALGAIKANLELEYFMVFYATYFVGYAVIGIVKTLKGGDPAISFVKTKMFAVSCLSLVIAGFGYMHKQPLLLILGSVIPLVYGLFVAVKKQPYTIPVNNSILSDMNMAASISTTNFQSPGISAQPTISQVGNVTGGNMASEYIDGKWYVYSFRATYGDTNSVGNVYFGMYAMWVGKTRELFFNYCLPDFNLKDTSFLILTRTFEHKFALEAREFDVIKVKIRVKSFNRKFATLEHHVINEKGQLLGKGTQSVLFVSATDYQQLDIPNEVLTAFIPFTT